MLVVSARPLASFKIKKKSSKSVDEDTNVVSIMLREGNDCDTLGDDGIEILITFYHLKYPVQTSFLIRGEERNVIFLIII